jgi:hypothetical protein
MRHLRRLGNQFSIPIKPNADGSHGEMVASNLIDVWDAKTFDEELSAFLAEEAELVRSYMSTEHRIFVSHDLGRGPEKSIIRPENPFSSAFLALKEAIGERIRSRTIRAWHYTRLTTAEVEILRTDGIHLSTPATLRARLDLQAAAGALSAQIADALHAASPFHSDQLQARLGKFWMVSHPLAPDDGGVKPLMAHWGGEVASMWMKDDPVLLAPLAAMGRPCIVELAVPLALTQHSYSAAQAVVATFGRTLGCVPSKHAFDLCVTTPLSPDSVLQVHSEGDPSFHAMGVKYPEGYVDVDLGHWEEIESFPPRSI